MPHSKVLGVSSGLCAIQCAELDGGHGHHYNLFPIS